MKIAFKNFLTTLRRYKVASLLNVVGLTLAFTAFYVIMVQVWWEASFNRAVPEAARIRLIAPYDEDDETFGTNSSRPDSERFIAESPEVEAGGTIRPGAAVQPVWTPASGSGYDRFEVAIHLVSPGFLDAVGVRTLSGDLHALVRPNTVALARSQAQRLGLVPGDALYVAADPRTAEPRPDRQLEVIAVYEDFPANSSFARIGAVQDVGERNIADNNMWNDCYFVRLREGADDAAAARRWERIHSENYKAWFERMKPRWVAVWGEEKAAELGEEEACTCKLLPLEGLYFNRELEDTDGRWPKGSLPTTLTLLGVAVLIIVIALINFVNFFFALVPVRLRAVNIFKVFGAPTGSLRRSFLFEAVGFVTCSLLCAWYLTFFLRSTRFASYVSASLAPGDNLPVVGFVAVAAVAAALVAGIYPAWYITSFSPALAAKGSFAGSAGGRRLRLGLVCVQFVVSTALILFTLVCYAQHRYIRRFDMGFDRKGVLTFEIPPRIANDYLAFESRLKTDPRIAEVTASASPFVLDAFTVWGRSYKGRDIPELHIRYVRSNFLDAMRIPVVEGPGFRPEYDGEGVERMIFTRRTARQYDIRPGETFGENPVAGICADFHFRPLQFATRPFAFVTCAMPMSFVYLRTTPGADVGAVTEHIRRIVRETAPGAGTPEVRFLDEQMADLYRREDRLAVIIALFALLSVAIALMGVFGVVLFETQHRRREIAVRKTFGATTGEILGMFNRRYILLTLGCFAAAAPAAWYAADRWLSAFAYRTHPGAWIFLAGLAAVLLITAATVTARSWQAARANPADAVKSE